MELLGRAGISVIAAGVGVLATSAVLSSVIGGLVIAAGGLSIPVWAVLLIGAGTVIAVGTAISYVSGEVKNAIFN